MIYDIGASNGVWSQHVSNVFDKSIYHLFEPLALRFEGYRATLRANLEAHPTFHLHPVALSSASSSREICVTRDGFSSTLINNWNYEGVSAKALVESWSLDDFVRVHSLEPPNIVKLDVQGTELEILQGADSSR